MSELFNWGGETPEQRQARLQWEQDILFEQARMKAMAMQAGAVGGSGGLRCEPLGGLKVNLDLSGFVSEESFGSFFISEQGIENGKTFYLSYDKEIDGENEYESWAKIAWNNKTSLWEFTQYDFDNGEIQYQGAVATSTSLYNDEWTMLEGDFPPIGTSSGSEFSCDWRYCLTISSGDGYSFSGSAVPAWIEVPLNESPNAYLSFGGGFQIFWSFEDSSWVVITDEDPILLGGTRKDLPTGTFDLGGGTLTLNPGICAVEPIPTF